MKKEDVEILLGRIGGELEGMAVSCKRVLEDVSELQDRLHRKGANILWQEAEVMESMRRELLAWIVRVQTGEEKL